jgi:acetolactate synthase-1/2/3 large subunit
MGYSLPAAIGAAAGGSVSGAFAISGDGGFMMNIQELAVAKNMDVPVKILLLDNKGYGIIRQTQNEFLGGRHFGSDIGEFPSLPEFGLEKLTEAFGFETLVSSVEYCTAAAEWLFEDYSMHRVVIVSIDPAESVKHTIQNFKPIA